MQKKILCRHPEDIIRSMQGKEQGKGSMALVIAVVILQMSLHVESRLTLNSLFGGETCSYLDVPLTSLDQKCTLELHEGCQMTIWQHSENSDSKVAIWIGNAKSYSSKQCMLVMQGGGNLVLLNNLNQVEWASGTQGNCWLQLDNDGVARIFCQKPPDFANHLSWSTSQGLIR